MNNLITDAVIESKKLHPNWDENDHLLNILAKNAKQFPDQVAMREYDHGVWQEYTWQQYLDEVLEVAAGLELRGVKAGDIVLFVGDNRPALYFGMLGAIALRAIPSPAYPDQPPEGLAVQIKSENIRYAIAEDQEQVDKILYVQEHNDCQFDLIIYDDPRGLKTEGIIDSYDNLIVEGKQRLQQNPELRNEYISRPNTHDIAALLHSSGTTGAPKGIPLKHGHILHGVRNAAAAGYFKSGEVHMAYLPIAWVGDFIFSVAATIDLRFSVNIPESRETIQHDLRQIAPTLYFCSPRTWSNMLTRIQVGIDESTAFKKWLFNVFMPYAIELERRRLDGKNPNLLEKLWRGVGEILIFGPIKDHFGLSKVQRPYTAGEAIGEEIFLFFRGLGLNLRQFYGQTENAALAAAQPADEILLHTVGRPFPGVEIQINTDGEILMRGDNVFDGYYNHPEDTAKTLQDGWLHTGDAGYLQDDGQLVVLGRVSEVVYTKQGERFIPTYIENRLQFSQYIQDVCLLGQDRDYLAAIVCIDFHAAGHWAQENNIAYSSYAELSQSPKVYDMIQKIIQNTNKTLPAELRISRFVNLHKAFDPDDGEVTRTRKLRRKVINDRYSPIIEALYSNQQSIDFEASITYETGDTGILKRTLALRDIPVAEV